MGLAGKRTTKSCPKCGKTLIIRQNRTTKQHFLGCEMWDKCTYTEPLPEHIKMQAMGAQALPGLE